MDIIEFANAVVGVPFKSRGRGRDGWDCWGLVIALYRECFGIELVDPPYESALKSAEVAEVYEKQKLLWSEIPAGQERAKSCVDEIPAGIMADKYFGEKGVKVD